MEESRKPLVEIRHLKKYFHISKDKILHAVDDVNLTVREGETVGLVGKGGISHEQHRSHSCRHLPGYAL